MSFIIDPPIRISFSVANMWERNYRWEAIQALKHEHSMPTSEAMAHGTERHESWENETRETGIIPSVFGYDWSIKPEVKRVVDLGNGVHLVVKTDGLCGKIKPEFVIDYKTSISKDKEKHSGQWLGTKQLPLYCAAFKCSVGYIFHEWIRGNRVKITTSKRLVSNDDKRDGIDWCVGIALDIHSFCIDNNEIWWPKVELEQTQIQADVFSDELEVEEEDDYS